MAAQTLVDKELEFLYEFSAECRSNTEAEAERVRSAIAEIAYFKAERRGFAPGYETVDWLEAEREVKQRMNHPL